MIAILTPDLPRTRQLQAAQGRYYWSRSAELLFRREGILSVLRVNAPTDDCTALVICRDVATPPETPAELPRIFEGPLAAGQLAAFGLVARACETDTLVIDAGEALALHLPEMMVRGADRTTQPLQFDAATAKWANQPFAVQFLQGEGWEPLLHATDPASGKEGAVVVRRGRDLVIGFSVFDILGRWLATPPLAVRYGGFRRMLRHQLLSARFVSLVVEHTVGAGAPHPLVIDRWPKGFSAALTVRHDYDRKARPEQLQALLALYDRLGIRASIGFLPSFLARDALDAFRSSGHEIQGHVASPTQGDLREDLRLLRQASGSPVAGVTIHGGPGGIGFRGQTHLEWFDDTGLAYCETFSLRDSIPVPICRLYDDVPDVSRMMTTAGHMSLDGSTAPDDHRLGPLLASVPASLAQGNHAIVMNHPDVHHEQLCTLLSRLRLDGVWRATTAEVANWHRATRYESLVQRQPDGYELRFPACLPYTGTVRQGDLAMDLDMASQSHRIHRGGQDTPAAEGSWGGRYKFSSDAAEGSWSAARPPRFDKGA